MVYTVVRKNAYYDSVTLMLATDEVKAIDGVEEALVGMATDTNKEFLKDLDMMSKEAEEAGPNDLLIVVKGKEGIMDEVLKIVDDFLKGGEEEKKKEEVASSLDSALEMMPDADLVLISIAGEYAGKEAMKAVEKGLHVMLFSDNVSLEEEIEVKKKAIEKGLLVMGPDCGTAIINGVPLAFANVVRRGKIGIVAASGTGSQEVSSIVSNLSEGISQLIGTGGRDVKKDVGGLMFLEGIKWLTEDDETEVIVLISKPPAPEVVEKAVKLVKESGKKAVVHFIRGEVKDEDLVVGKTLEDTAIKAVLLAQGKEIEKDEYSYYEIAGGRDLEAMVKEQIEKIEEGKYIRGLYSGGTLADEAMVLFSKEMGCVWSPSPIDEKCKLENINESKENTVVDMGEDEFTRGRPHPMIDFTMRKERLIKEYMDPEVAIIILDVVLGYGSHMDPASEIAEAVSEARKRYGKYKLVVANILGTKDDPQGYDKQWKTLEDAGVVVFPSNATAVKFALEVWKGLRS